MKRFGMVLAAVAGDARSAWPAAAAGRTAATRRADAVKIDVMGEWAHPDDDTSIIGPCGVWHSALRRQVRRHHGHPRRGRRQRRRHRDRAGARAAARERGPRRALPLGHRRHLQPRPRRLLLQPERAADAVLLGRARRRCAGSRAVIRTTQPEIYIGFTPTLDAGHGNHQQAGPLHLGGRARGRRPDAVPRAAARARTRSAPGRSRRSSPAARPPAPAARRPRRTAPPASPRPALDTVAGVWTGYDSPYKWPAGQPPGPARPGTPKSWAQVAHEGRAAYPTQSRMMFKGTAAPGCSRFGMTRVVRPVPAERQPDGSPTRGRPRRRDPLRRDRSRTRAGCRWARWST